MIYTVTLNPALDKTVEIPSLSLNRVNRIASMRTDPGGKGINVSKVIQKLGGESTACGILGGHTGEAIRSAVSDMGIKTFFAFEPGETRTNLKIIDPVSHTNTDINEPGITVSEEVLEKLLVRIASRIKPGDIAAISGSVPKGSPEDTYGTWVKTLKGAGAKVFLDADGVLFKNGLKASPYLVKPNNFELSEFTGTKLETPEDIKAAALKLMEQYKVEKTVVSMGGDGALYLLGGGCIYAKGLKVPVGSTVGAGDSVVAALAYAEEKGLSPEETVRLSTAAGAANVMCSGSQAAEYEVIKELMPKVEMTVL